MKKTKLLQLALVLSCIFSPALSQAKPGTVYQSSERVFRDFVGNNNFLREQFQSYQRHMLNTPLEQKIWQYIESNEILAEFNRLSDTFYTATVLDDFDEEAITKYIEVVPGVTKQFDHIHRSAQRVGRRLGFSNKALINMQIYHDAGAPNAFTVSGNSEVIIIVVNSQLVKNTSVQELEGILGHEMGHIRSKHTILGMMNNIMLLGSTALLTGEDLAPIASSLQGMGELGAFVMELFSQPIEVLQPLLTNYLEVVVNNIPKDELQKSSFQFWAQAIQYMKAPQSLLKGRIPQKLMTAELKQLNSAISRQQEKSADYYAASIMPNKFLASSFLKLMDPEFTKEERSRLIQQIMVQYNKYLTLSEEKRIAFRGESHTRTVLRTAELMNIDSLRTILLANPFLKLVSFKYFLRVQTENADIASDDALLAPPAIKALHLKILELVKTMGLESKSNPRFDNLVQFYSVEQALELKSSGTPAKFETLDAMGEMLTQELKRLWPIEEEALLKQRLSIVQQIQKPKSFKKLQELRTKITPEGRSRIAIDLKDHTIPICADLF